MSNERIVNTGVTQIFPRGFNFSDYTSSFLEILFHPFSIFMLSSFVSFSLLCSNPWIANHSVCWKPWLLHGDSLVLSLDIFNSELTFSSVFSFFPVGFLLCGRALQRSVTFAHAGAEGLLDNLFSLTFRARVSARHAGCKFRCYLQMGLEFGFLKEEGFPHPSALSGLAALLIPNQWSESF